MALNQSYRAGITRTHLLTKVCSQINPFCRESLGSKIPDESSGYTLPFQTHFFSSLISDANGNLALYVQPYPAAMYWFAASINSSTGIITWSTATNSPDFTGIGQQYRELRVVSWGVRVMTVLPWTTAAGTAIATSIQTTPTAGGTNVTTVTSMNNGSDTQAYAVRDLDITFIGRPTDHMWTAFNTFNNIGELDSSAVPWSQFLFTSSGCPASSSVFSFEVVVNYEFRSLAGTTYTTNQLATGPAASNDPLSQIVSTVRQSLPSTFTTTGSSSIDAMIMDMAMKTMRKMGPQLMSSAIALL